MNELRELVALLKLSSWCLVIGAWLFLAVSWVCLQFVIVESPDHTHYFCFYFNPFMPSGISHLYCLDESISVLRDVGLHYSNFNKALCKKTVETLIRRCVMGLYF